MQGTFDHHGSRFATKKALKFSVENGHPVHIEATSFFGNEYDGPLADAPNGTYNIVGPDPHKKRNWYANIKKTDTGVTIS